jgi:hypothetical protein
MDGKPFEFRRLDAAPPGKDGVLSERSGTRVSTIVIEQAQELFQTVTPDGIRVQVKPLGANGPATILAIDEEGRKMVEMSLVVREMREIGRLNELPEEVRDAAENGFLDFMAQHVPRTLILNSEQPLVRRFFKLLASPEQRRTQQKGKGRFFGWLQAAPTEAGPLDLRDVPPLLARFLYGQALLASGLPLPRDDRNAITQSQTELISNLLTHLQPES